MTCFTGASTINNDVTFNSGASICVGTGATLSFGGNNYTFNSPSTAVNIDVYGTLNVNQNPTWTGNVNLIVHSGATLNIPNTITLKGSVMNITNDGTFNAGILQFQQTGAVITITNNNSMHVTGTLNITNGNAYFKNTGSLTIDGNYNSNSTSTYVNCGTYYGKFNLNSGGKLINTGVFNTTQIDYGGSTSRVENYGRFNVAGSINLGGSGSVFYNEGITTFSAGQFQSDGNLQGPSDSSKRGYFVWSNKATMNSGTIGPNLNLRNPGTTSSQATMFNNPGGMTWGSNLTWGNADPGSLPVTDCPSADGTPAVPVLPQSTACTPVNLTALQPSYSNVTYEWWTGTSSSRTTQIISSLTNYSTASTIYLWAKNVSSGVYSTSGAVLTVNPTPTITDASPILKGSNVTLTGTFGTPAASNAWVSNNTSVATVTSGGAVTGVAAGSAIITYTNSGGCTATTTIVVYTKYSNTAIISGKETDPDLSNNSATVIPVPRPVTSFSYSSSSYCATAGTTAAPVMDTYGVKGTFSATPAGLAINFSTGEINLGASAAGTYEVTNTVAAQGDYAANSAKTNVTVYALPVPTITGSGAACANSTGNVYSTESGMSNYVWNVSGGTITSGGTSTSNTATVTWGSAGTGTISVNYSNANGCVAAASTNKSITINALPTATISGTTSVCQSSTAPSITFTGSNGTAPYTFSYSVSDGTNTTSTTVTSNSGGVATVPASTITVGTFTYTLTSVKDASSTTCSNTVTAGNTATVTVNALPTFTACPSTINQNTAYDLCTAIVNYTVTATGTPTPTLTYVFTGATTGSGSGTGTGSVFNKGITHVTVTATNTCGSVDCNFDVVVTDVQPPVITTCPVTRNIEGCSTANITSPAYSTSQTASTYAVFSSTTNSGAATDNCGVTQVLYQDVASGTCPITVTRTWTVKDEAGNSTTCDQTITIKHTDFTMPANDGKTVACVADAVAPTVPVVTDNCGNTLTASAPVIS
ncbi:MAG: Ig-like domain-containing protein, partial [Bacteroidota bacterium]|nr:Ig-like domain-containing protein [Bacteroidota bacterium]